MVAEVNQDARFLAAMAVAIAITVLVAFGLFAALGFSSFGAPWWVHVHAITMMGWVAIFLTQNLLIARGQMAVHRRLGLIGAAWSLWLVPVGLLTTYWCVTSGRTPPFFEPRFFLVMDWLNVLLFAALTWSGLALRKQTDWHRRLILGGTLTLLGPAFGRLLPLPLLGHMIVPATTAVILIFLIVAMRHDQRVHGAVHPAHWCTLAALGLYSTLPFALA